MIAARPIAVPRALRPSWLSERLSELAGMAMFGTLLVQLAPRTYAGMRDKTPLGCFVALCNHLDTLFPVNSYGVEVAAEGVLMGDSTLQDIFAWGIPVDVHGFDDGRDYGDPPSSPADCVCLCFGSPSNFQQDSTTDYAVYSTLDDYREGLPAPRVVDPRKLKPPRGRKWLPPWDGLLDLFAYVHHATGYDMLDLTGDDLAEMAAEMPPWNLDEIKSLAKSWAECKAILDRAEKLRQYIDAQPEERLPLLAGALAGDREALREITLAKSPKRLIDVWK